MRIGYWTIYRDPMRPYWPGVLLFGPNGVVRDCVAGKPENFDDSFKRAVKLAKYLNWRLFRTPKKK